LHDYGIAVRQSVGNGCDYTRIGIGYSGNRDRIGSGDDAPVLKEPDISIIEGKNPLGLIKACSPFLKANRCTLALAGQFDPAGEYGMAFQREAHGLLNIDYLGFLGRDKLAAEFAKSSAIVLPTFEDNCPMVVLEAMAAGLPVAASRVGGVPDLVDHQITGLLFDPGNLEDMRECIELLISNPEFRISAGQAGKRKALEVFHPSRIAKRHIEIYQEVLGKN
jgi:glycosyltransferase involved in cell wall biosynthesis